MNFVIVTKTRQGYLIKDDNINFKMHYVGYNLKNAKKAYRQQTNNKYKHINFLMI